MPAVGVVAADTDYAAVVLGFAEEADKSVAYTWADPVVMSGTSMDQLAEP